MSKKEKIFPLNTFGGRMQDLRKNRLNISRPEFYDLIFPNGNVATESKSRTVKNWESGDCEPDLKTIEKICIVFKCSSDYLLGLDNCTTKDTQFIHDKTGLSEKVIQIIQKMKRSSFGRRLLASLEILVLDIEKFNGDKYYKRFLELFSDYLQFSGDNNKRYSFSKNGEIKEERPTHDEFGNKKFNKDRVYITSDSLKYMFIMEMEDSLKYLKREYDKNPHFLN